ncbi:hypothetical protein ES332_D04G061100v1 [Gossypium tomentosum]|uniref:non-specific serine/threonine protein kinase n=2 Tax=Gossypium tomentosum TaxID=34277 RepID=A0A5D2LAC9_GOSTO|nr:hypothetical protein ES332_D04G061100v1 [Gossypium tomentosum]
MFWDCKRKRKRLKTPTQTLGLSMQQQKNKTKTLPTYHLLYLILLLYSLVSYPNCLKFEYCLIPFFYFFLISNSPCLSPRLTLPFFDYLGHITPPTFLLTNHSGGDLHILRQRQPGKHFTEPAARFYASEVLLALEYLHMMGVVYRDLKPENVLVREDGHIMLSDFDLSLRCFVNPTLVQSCSEPSCRITSYCIQPACIDPACKLPVCVEPACLQPSCFKPRFLSSKTTKVKSEKTNLVNSDSFPVLIAEPTNARSMSFVGTHEYLAPEIIRGDGHGSAVDWWTFGIFLYELLLGRTPFKGNDNRETLFNVVGQSLKFTEGSSISFAAKDLIRGLLVKDPQKRLGFRRGATEIKQHPFFESVNWALIRSTHPPEIPKPIDIPLLNQAFKSSLPSNDKGATDSDRSSGPYLDFEFF